MAGYIVIDQAEALTVVDVNSGRFVGKSNLEETITRINLEAVKETAYQMRLRVLAVLSSSISLIWAKRTEEGSCRSKLALEPKPALFG